MMIGDGMDATVISGNRSYVDGWTTFRSATFGRIGRQSAIARRKIENHYRAQMKNIQERKERR